MEEWAAHAIPALNDWLDGKPPDAWLRQGVEVASSMTIQMMQEATDEAKAKLLQGADSVQAVLEMAWLANIANIPDTDRVPDIEAGFPVLLGSFGQVQILELADQIAREMPQTLEAVKTARGWNSNAIEVLMGLQSKIDQTKRRLADFVKPIDDMYRKLGKTTTSGLPGLAETYTEIMQLRVEITDKLNLIVDVVHPVQEVLNAMVPILRDIDVTTQKVNEQISQQNKEGALNTAISFRTKLLKEDTVGKLLKLLENQLLEKQLSNLGVAGGMPRKGTSKHAGKLLEVMANFVDHLQVTGERLIGRVKELRLPCLPLLPQEIVQAADAIRSISNCANPEVMGALASIGGSIAESVFARKDAMAAMKKWQLPGDETTIHSFKAKNNFTPFALLPFFMLMFILEDMQGYQTPAVYSSNSSMIFDDFPDSVSTNWHDGANAIAPLLENNTLQCMFGNHRVLDPFSKTAVCPPVYQLHGDYYVPFLWSVPFLLMFIFMYIMGSKSGRSNGESRVGSYLQIYGGGYTDAHLYLWCLSLSVIFMYSLISRLAFFTHQNKCMGWADWAGHSDKCLRAVAFEPHTMPFFAVCSWFLWCTAMSGAGRSVKEEEPVAEQIPASRMLDKTTANAVKIKGLVRKQWLVSDATSMPPAHDLMEIGKITYEIIKPVLGDVEDIACDLCDDFADELSGIVSDLRTADVDSFVAEAKGLYEKEIAGCLSPELRAMAEKKMYDSIEDAKAKASRLTEVNIHQLVGNLDAVKVGLSSRATKLCAVSGFPCLGFVVGMLWAVYLISNMSPMDWEFGIDSSSLNAHACVLKGDYGCLPADSVWTHVRFIFEGGFSLPLPEIEGRLLLQNLTPLTVIAISLKLIGTGCFGALLFCTVTEARKGLESAARPMVILSGILNSWIFDKSKKATTTELEAWWDARRSFLHNEVALTLKKYQNTVLGYLALAVMAFALEAIRIAFLKQQPHTMLLPMGVLMLFFSYVNLSAAMKCDNEQKKHVDLLESLKANFAGDTKENNRIKEAIGARIAMIENRDFQTRLFFFPLQPKVVGVLTGYFVSSGGAILYGLISNQN